MSGTILDPKELVAELETVQGLAATAANPHLLDSLRDQAAAGVVARVAALRQRAMEAAGLVAASAPTGARSSSTTPKPGASGSRS